MDKLSYAIGMSVGLHLLSDGVKEEEINFDDFISGVKDTIKPRGELKMKPSKAQEIINRYFDEMDAKLNAAAAAKAEEYLKENAKKEGVKVTDSGLQYRILREGGIMKWPNAHSRVRVHYEGRLADGTVFDSSYERAKPEELNLDQVIPGWAEGLCLMKPGAMYEFVLPPVLGYGETGVPGHIPGNSVLIFTIELLDIL
jgi:FKBP-type peptidyl-prolyl cis-trans isomerase FklB